MIALFLDESGNFEVNNKPIESLSGQKPADVVGGILCYGLRNENDLKNLNNRVKQEFINVCGDNYFENIHGKSRVGKYQTVMLDRLFSGESRLQGIIPFYIEKGVLDKKINSNITDDNTACMLYINMLNRVLSGILLYNPDLNINKSNEKVYIFLPTRRPPIHKLDNATINSYRSLSAFVPEDIDDRFRIPSSTSVLINLNNELSSMDYLCNRIDFSIQEHTIDYSKSDFPYNELYQIADFVCNNAYFKVQKLEKEYVLAYDNINECYRRLYRNYMEKNLYGYLMELYYYNINFCQNRYKKLYDKHIAKLDEGAIIISNNIRQCMTKLDIVIAEKSYERKCLKFVLDYLEQHIEALPAKDNLIRQQFYYLKMSVYNHLGDFKGNLMTYKKLDEVSKQINSLESIDLRLRARKLYAVTCSNSFQFRDALSAIDDTIAIHEELQSLVKNIGEMLFDEALDSSFSDVEMGKLYSSKGQYLSFLNNEEAYECFYSAIDYMGLDTANRLQTISYLMHHLAMSNRHISQKDRELMIEYFGCGNFSGSMQRFIELDSAQLMIPPESFRLFAFLKLYLMRFRNELDMDLLDKFTKKILNLEIKRMEHPWELILFNLGKFYFKEIDLSRTLMKAACSICNNAENDLTMELIGKMIMVNCEANDKSIKSFCDFLQSDKATDYIRTYFEISKLMDTSLTTEEKINLINSKFTYMYC
ncbi:MAG TPA: hypothetical protein GX505_02235 [Clostridiales bacterium]|nr:hypothetical protein [Clostridiales bacterium]